MVPCRSRSERSRRSMSAMSGCPRRASAWPAESTQPRRAISSCAKPTFMLAGTATFSLLADGGDGVALIVVRGIDQRGARQLEQPAEDGLVLLARVAILEVGAARAANEQCVAGEHPVREDKTVGVVG